MTETTQLDHLRPQLVQGLFSAGRTVRLYDSNNRAVHAVTSKLLQTLREIAEAEGRVAVTVSSDLLLVNGVRIILDSLTTKPTMYLVEEMKARKVEEIVFPFELTVMELGSFLGLFFADPPEKEPFADLHRRLVNAGVTRISIAELLDREKHLREPQLERPGLQQREVREASNRVTSRAVRFMGEVTHTLEQQLPIPMSKAHRITQQIADIIQTDETILVGLASIKSYDEYTYSHSVNVSVLSMLIADRMGLSKTDTAQIGVAGLLHDIGKTHVPQSILNKPGTLDPEEWKFMERHTLMGVIELCRVKSVQAVIDPIFVAMQHHLFFNGTGYPRKSGAWKLHPYVHLIIVADIFDAMTTPRIYRQMTPTPDKVLRFILAKAGTMFDPLVAKVFVRAMGVYPVGTVVELDTGERAVVVRQNEQEHLLHRPVVMLLHEQGPGGDPINLAEQAKTGTIYRRSVVRAVHDELLEIQKAGYFVTK